jgi:hypothetical protein
LRGSTYRKTNTISAEESSLRSTVAAQVEVDVGSVLIGAAKSVLSTQRVAIGWAEVVDHDHDGCASIGEGIA